MSRSTFAAALVIFGTLSAAIGAAVGIVGALAHSVTTVIAAPFIGAGMFALLLTIAESLEG